jgi:hypothetical protein
MKAKETVSRIRIASLFFKRSNKCSSSTLLIVAVILSIAIVYPAIAHTTASAKSNVVSPPCQNHIGASSNGNVCYPIFSPRLNVPIPPSGVTGDPSQPRLVGFIQNIAASSPLMLGADTSPIPVSSSCHALVVGLNNKNCQAIFSPRLNVPLSGSGVTIEGYYWRLA